jgi:hypothetical protein
LPSKICVKASRRVENKARSLTDVSCGGGFCFSVVKAELNGCAKFLLFWIQMLCEIAWNRLPPLMLA